MTMDISNIYLNTPFDWFEYMRPNINNIPDKTINKYNLQHHVSDGLVYKEIRKVMCCLKQSGAFASENLKMLLHLNLKQYNTQLAMKTLILPYLFYTCCQQFRYQIHQ